MAKQLLNRGITANDGTGDTLRTAAQKINENFAELYTSIGGDSATANVKLAASGAIFEGLASNAHQTVLSPVEPTQDNTVYIPDDSGTLILDSCAQTLTNKTILVPTLTTPKIRDANASHTYNVLVGDISANRNISLPALQSNDEFVFANATQTLLNKTIGGLTVNNPVFGGISGGSILFDSADNEYLKFVKTASAVNFVTMTNSATGNSPSIDVDGGDTNISLELAAKGTGAVEIKNKLVLEKGTDVASTTAIDMNEPLTVFNSGSQILPTIGDGTIQGEVKYFSNVGAGEARLTVGGTSNIYGVGNNGHISFGQGDGCILVWNSTKSKWFFVSNNGTTIG
jgi:hypothetical protein|tara:strand:- start:143 stop:1168 length:1026 start_codon:yes stop_codon:yes gene_type:complete